MHDHDGNPKDNFVMSGKQVGGDDREESYGYQAEDSNRPKSMKPVLIGGGILLVAVIVLLMFLSGSPKTAERDLLKSLESRLKIIEEKLAKLDWIDTGMARLERKEKEMATVSERMAQFESALTKRVDQLSKDMSKPAAKPAEPAAPKAESAAPHKPEPAASKAAAPAKAEKDPKARTHAVQKGDTVFGISRKYGISPDQLMKLNKLNPNDPIKPGQQLMLPAKSG